MAERLWKGGSSAGSRAIDFGVLLAVVLAASWAFDHNPRGWIATNPSLFFLLPLLMGGRYGPLAGLLSGAGAAAVLLVSAILQTGGAAADIASASKFALICLPLAGAICGEVQRFLSKDVIRARIQLDHTSRRMRALDEQVFILAETKDELDRELALLNADAANMDYEIRRVLQSPPERFYGALLGVLGRKARLYEAAIYEVGPPWRRAAYSGKPDIWPEHDRFDGSPVVQAALAEGAIATLPELWDRQPTCPDDFLVACPIGAADRPAAMLVVRSMPFSSMNARGMQIIETICRWISEFSDLQHQASGLFDPRRLVGIEDFERLLALACLVQNKFQLSSSVILLRPAEGDRVEPDRMRDAIESSVRLGDVLSATGAAAPHMVLLLPLTGQRGAEICLERVIEQAGALPGAAVEIRGEILLTSDVPTLEAFRARVAGLLSKP